MELQKNLLKSVTVRQCNVQPNKIELWNSNNGTLLTVETYSSGNSQNSRRQMKFDQDTETEADTKPVSTHSVITRSHSFPRAAEFWVEPWNLSFATEF